MEDQDRLGREIEFHDNRFGSDDARKSSRFYAITGESSEAYHELISHLDRSDRVLELGCGDNAEAWGLAQKGQQVVAIDISSVAIDAARVRADSEGLATLTFETMNAEQLRYGPNEFDAVIGSGILHHLDLDSALPEIANVLRPDGVAIFLEPLGHNPLLNLYRRVTPSERSPDEHPLLRSDLRNMERWFDQVDLQFFHAASLAALPLMKTPYFDRALGALNKLDQVLLQHSPTAQNLSWFVTIELRGPKALKAAV